MRGSHLLCMLLLQYYIYETYAPSGTNPPHSFTAVTAKVCQSVVLHKGFVGMRGHAHQRHSREGSLWHDRRLCCLT